MRSTVHSFLIGLLATTSLTAIEPTAGEKLFALHVQPLFAERCAACHGEDKQKGGFDMRSRESTLKGGDEFANEVLIPSDAAKSYLYRLTTRTIEDYEMPPKEADKLPEEEQWHIRDWINAGAPWPDEKRANLIREQYAEGEKVTTSKALDDSWQNRRYEPEKLWSYRPLKTTKVPADQH
ncbi:c-type cytochrome, partial [bacterium]|nr:c-type cytochrome [bacterium]